MTDTSKFQSRTDAEFALAARVTELEQALVGKFVTLSQVLDRNNPNFEYDQGDLALVHFDDVYDLNQRALVAEAKLQALAHEHERLLRRLEVKANEWMSLNNDSAVFEVCAESLRKVLRATPPTPAESECQCLCHWGSVQLMCLHCANQKPNEYQRRLAPGGDGEQR